MYTIACNVLMFTSSLERCHDMRYLRAACYCSQTGLIMLGTKTFLPITRRHWSKFVWPAHWFVATLMYNSIASCRCTEKYRMSGGKRDRGKVQEESTVIASGKADHATARTCMHGKSD